MKSNEIHAGQMWARSGPTLSYGPIQINQIRLTDWPVTVCTLHVKKIEVQKFVVFQTMFLEEVLKYVFLLQFKITFLFLFFFFL